MIFPKISVVSLSPSASDVSEPRIEVKPPLLLSLMALVTVFLVFFDTSSSADETIKAINEIRELMDGHIYVSGMSAFVADLRALSESEQIYYIIIAVILAMLVMWLMLDNWLSTVLFMESIGMMIILNLGTNWDYGEISYITKA